jgi:type I restriction enzyme S subunit
MGVKAVVASIADDKKTRQGFKKTEIGPLPSDWKVEKIGEMSRIKTGAKNTQDNIGDGAYPFFVRSQKVERIDSFSYDTEAVLTAGDGVGTGRVFHYVKGRFDVHQRVYCISNFASRLNGRYFFYQFSLMFYNRIASMTAKSSVDSVRMNMISEMRIPVPPINEQYNIASALSDVDALIESLDTLIAKKRALKLAAMQQLLTGEIRLPGFDGKWEIQKLRDIASCASGGTPPTEVVRFYGGPHPWVSIDDMTSQGKYLSRTARSLSAEGLSNSSAKLWPKGTILYAMYASIGECSIATVQLCSSQAILGIQPNVGIDTDYLYYHLLSKKTEIKRMVQQGTQPNLNADIVKSFDIRVPSIVEQGAIATVLSDMDAEISILEARRDKLKDLKQGMMQALLVGKVRLVEPEVNS